jgi:tetratricopeptide (TPR) repeat protein
MDDGGISGVGQELKELFSSIVDDIDDVTTLTDAEVSTYARRFITWDEGERAFDFLCRSRDQYATFFASFGSLCSDRGDHRLASKLFAKAGDKVSSLTSLINTQDTKTIVAFAKAAKTDQAYEMAAAYLQSLPDWTQEEQHISSILFFLSKVENYSELAQVHEALARACVDESEDYEKALDLLTQGASYVEKIDDVHQRATLRRRFQRQLYSVTKFLRAKKSLKQSAEPMEVFCAEAASREDGNTENIVRVEHGIKDLVLQYVSVHRYRDAFDLIHAMDYPSKYIPRNVMEQVWTACNRDPREVAAIIAEDENRDDSIFAPDDGKLGDGAITDEERTVLSGLGLNF